MVASGPLSQIKSLTSSSQMRTRNPSFDLNVARLAQRRAWPSTSWRLKKKYRLSTAGRAQACGSQEHPRTVRCNSCGRYREDWGLRPMGGPGVASSKGRATSATPPSRCLLQPPLLHHQTAASTGLQAQSGAATTSPQDLLSLQGSEARATYQLGPLNTSSPLRLYAQDRQI